MTARACLDRVTAQGRRGGAPVSLAANCQTWSPGASEREAAGVPNALRGKEEEG